MCQWSIAELKTYQLFTITTLTSYEWLNSTNPEQRLAISDSTQGYIDRSTGLASDLEERLVYKHENLEPNKDREFALQMVYWPGVSLMVLDRVVVTTIAGLSQE
jgi:hypothetical protein